MNPFLKKTSALLVILVVLSFIYRIALAAGGIADPDINYPSGTYGSGLRIRITATTPDSIIYYTTDGSEPSDTHGTQYSGPFGINYNATLRAVACKTPLCSSSTDRSYVFSSSHAGGGGTSNPSDVPGGPSAPTCDDDPKYCPPEAPKSGNAIKELLAPLFGNILFDGRAIEESKNQYTGVLNIFHTDDFVHKVATHYYQLLTADGKVINLKFTKEEDKPNHGNNGREVTISGKLSLDAKTLSVSKMYVADIKENDTARVGPDQFLDIGPADVNGVPKSKAVRQYKIATILFNFSNNQNTTSTPAAARHDMYDNTPGDSLSVNGFFTEATYGKLIITGTHNTYNIPGNGDVYGWYTLPHDDTGCTLYSASIWAQEAAQIAAQAGFNANDYDSVVFIFPVPFGGCQNWGGFMTTLNFGSENQPIFKKIAVNTGGYQGNIVHELGHVLELNHSKALSCVDANNQPVTFFPGSCFGIEYGDPFDIMAATWRHFTTYQKKELGVLSSNAILNISSTQSGQYDIYPQETLGFPGSTRMIQITDLSDGGGGTWDSMGNFIPASKSFTLEYRRPYGVWDNFQSNDPVVNGVSIRNDLNHVGYILDMHPNTATFSDAPLAVGESFTFSSGRTITVVFADSAKATISTTTSPPTSTVCTRIQAGSFNMSNNYLNYNPNYVVSDDFTTQYHIANRDSVACGPSTFEIPLSIAVHGYNNSTVLATQQAIISPGTYQSFNVNYILDSSLAIGNFFMVNNQFTNLDTNTTALLSQAFIYQPTPLTGNLSTQ